MTTHFIYLQRDIFKRNMQIFFKNDDDCVVSYSKLRIEEYRTLSKKKAKTAAYKFINQSLRLRSLTSFHKINTKLPPRKIKLTESASRKQRHLALWYIYYPNDRYNLTKTIGEMEVKYLGEWVWQVVLPSLLLGYKSIWHGVNSPKTISYSRCKWKTSLRIHF